MTTATMPQKLTDLHPALQARCLTVAQAASRGIQWSLPTGRRDFDDTPLAIIAYATQMPGVQYPSGDVYNWQQIEWALVAADDVVALIL